MKTLSTKRALFASMISLLLCVTMLVGSTFAWFTDTATASVNTIQAGTLDVALEMKDNDGDWVSAEGKTLEFLVDGKIPAEGTKILWEPGCTYSLPELRVVNNGNLALKYKIVVTGLDGDTDLLKAIKFTYKLDDTVLDLNEEGHLLPKEATGAITVSATMDKTAGNEYMGMVLEGVGIRVYATQYTYEKDSVDDRYDKNATYYPVIDIKGLENALKGGGNVIVDADVTVYGTDSKLWRTTVNKPTTLTLNKKIISPDNIGDNSYNYAALFIDADTTINAGTNGGIDTGKNGAYCLTVKSGTLTINGGYYYGGGTAVQVEKGELIINGGTFACEPYSDPKFGNKFLINCIDSAYKDGTAKISIKGGTFINFDPSDSASENPHGNFVADGYSVISETQPNGDVWYTVVEGNVTTLTPDTVNNAGIYHSDETYFLSAGDYGEFTATLEQSYKNVTFLASENAKFKEVTIRYHGGTPSAETISAKGDSTLTVKGFRVSGGISINSFDKNVIVEENAAASIALKTNYVADMDVRFLNNDLGSGTVSNGYGIYFVPNTTNYDLTITGNTFTGTNSHAIAVQGYGDGSAVTAAKSIIVKDNIFHSYGLNGKAGRAAFKIWSDTNLAPSDKADLTASAKALADSVKVNNTFASDLDDNCVVADFYGKTVAFN